MSPLHSVGIGHRKSPRIVSRLGPPRTKIALADLHDPDCGDPEPAERETPWFRSATALGLAAGLHVLVALVAAFVVLAERREDPPIVNVVPLPTEVAPEEIPLPPPEKNIPTSAAPSGSTADVLLGAAAPVSIPIPDSPPMDDAIDFGGTGMGDGLGMGFGGGVGKIGGANFFGIPAGKGARSLALVLDVSGSMTSLGQDGIQAMKDQVDATLAGLDATSRFNLFTFAGEADGFKERSVNATSGNLKSANLFLRDYLKSGTGFSDTRTARFGDDGRDDNGIYYVPIEGDDFDELKDSGGGTRIELGVLAAMRDKPEVIYVLSDGEPISNIGGKNVTERDLIMLIEKYRDANYGRSPKLTIHTISVGSIGRDGKQFLRKLARAFGGRYSDVDLKALKKKKNASRLPERVL